jgi:hypothetical protein
MASQRHRILHGKLRKELADCSASVVLICAVHKELVNER